jgi:hypothetical protein
MEGSLTTKNMASGDTIHNGHERDISFNLINLINLGQKPISHILATGLCLPGQYPPQARTHWRSGVSVIKRFPSSLMIRQSGLFLPDNQFKPLLLNVRKDRSLSMGRTTVICSTLMVSGLAYKKQPTRASPSLPEYTQACPDVPKSGQAYPNQNVSTRARANVIKQIQQ